LIQASFVDRPNRFTIRCRDASGRLLRAYLPNPGRLAELLLPDAVLLLAGPGPAGKRRTRYTVVAVERDGRPIMLHTHLCNSVACWLIERGLIAELAGARVKACEVSVGECRFDLLLDWQGEEVYVEVKSCTLYGNSVAMFPDAVTVRGRRHLEALAELAERGVRAMVLFLVQTPLVHYFMPDYHTDFEFSRTLLQVRDRIEVLPVAIEWLPDLSLAARARTLIVPWRELQREVADRGCYILVLRLNRRRCIGVGQLGAIRFEPGYYLYVGSALQSLSARLVRHARKRKQLHWHVDYLREACELAATLPIRTSERCECKLAGALAEVFEPGPQGFGSSDCRCRTHLFFSSRHPLNCPAMHGLLQNFRMRPPQP
jgi:sugar fermentation stimulation protein A